jgi:DNA polymerase
LIVDGSTESADAGSRAAAEADQEMLLVNMLRSIGVSAQAGAADARWVQVRTGTPAMDDLDRLHRQVRPRCVLVLGRAPAMALLGIDEPLGRLRGRVHGWRGIPVVVTFSLAYLLRHPGDKAKAWLDLCLAATAIDAPAPA